MRLSSGGMKPPDVNIPHLFQKIKAKITNTTY